MEASEFGVFRGGNFLQTLSRGLRVLEVLGDVARPLQPNEIAEALGVPRPAAYRLLTTLRAHKMVTPAPGGGYVLGYGIITLARQVDRDFRHQIRRLLPRLSNELSATISVGVEEGDDLVCIAAAEPSGPGTHVRWMEGLRHPTGYGAHSVAILSTHPRARRHDPELEKVHRAGYAVSEGSVLAGVRAIAVPIIPQHGKCTMSIASLQPTNLESSPELHAYHLRTVAQEIARMAW